MSTCVKIIFREENDGVDVRVGYDETPDATETELNYAIAFAQQLSVLVQDMANAQNLKKRKEDPHGKA